jgi:fatty acid/phospholipid biosynthesis enzyme
MVDVGANVDCSPRMLRSFRDGRCTRASSCIRTTRASDSLDWRRRHKGNEVPRAATPLLKRFINFIGNVEAGISIRARRM